MDIPSSPSDEELLKRLCSDDREALGMLFRRYSTLAHGIARRILRDGTEADDFVQDLFLYIRRKCAVYNAAKSQANSWIIQTIYYQALQRRLQLAERSRQLSTLDQTKAPLIWTPRERADYERSLEGMIGRAKLHEMLECLTEEQWDTLRLHFFEGYTLSEIAEKKDQKLGNIRHHFYRGLEKLRSSVFCSELQQRITSGTK